MSSILDKMLPAQQFTPTSADEYLALQLAKRLGDESNVKRYVHYCERHPSEHLLQIFQKVSSDSKPVEAFHSSLAIDS